ncbi:MAG: hypothetical protein M1829_006034 [Trizodia sp. TS-e1964]|nr:MAG: hypothetical protein M1829_006034 [Trizodia sp. TS-e1964]
MAGQRRNKRPRYRFHDGQLARLRRTRQQTLTQIDFVTRLPAPEDLDLDAELQWAREASILEPPIAVKQEDILARQEVIPPASLALKFEVASSPLLSRPTAGMSPKQEPPATPKRPRILEIPSSRSPPETPLSLPRHALSALNVSPIISPLANKSVHTKSLSKDQSSGSKRKRQAEVEYPAKPRSAAPQSASLEVSSRARFSSPSSVLEQIIPLAQKRGTNMFCKAEVSVLPGKLALFPSQNSEALDKEAGNPLQKQPSSVKLQTVRGATSSEKLKDLNRAIRFQRTVVFDSDGEDDDEEASYIADSGAAEIIHTGENMPCHIPQINGKSTVVESSIQSSPLSLSIEECGHNSFQSPNSSPQPSPSQQATAQVLKDMANSTQLREIFQKEDSPMSGDDINPWGDVHGCSPRRGRRNVGIFHTINQTQFSESPIAALPTKSQDISPKDQNEIYGQSSRHASLSWKSPINEAHGIFSDSTEGSSIPGPSVSQFLPDSLMLNNFPSPPSSFGFAVDSYF